jgi:hypothetical protein
MRKSLEDKKSPPPYIKVNKKDKDKKQQPPPKQQTPQLFINPKQQLNKPIFFPNIPQTENIFVMEIKPPIEKISSSSHKIEEIIEEKNNEDLDREIEKELQELEKEIIADGGDEEEDEDGSDDEEEDE